MSTSDRGFFAPLSHDLRVRERMLAAGVVTPADIQQYLAALPDHEAHCEALGIPQPALNTPQPPAPAPAPIRVAPAPIASSHSANQSRDMADDDEDDEDDDEDEVVAAKPEEAAPAPEAPPAHTIAVGEPHPATPEASNEPPAVIEEVHAEAAPAKEAPKAEGGDSNAAQPTEEQAG